MGGETPALGRTTGRCRFCACMNLLAEALQAAQLFLCLLGLGRHRFNLCLLHLIDALESLGCDNVPLQGPVCVYLESQWW